MAWDVLILGGGFGGLTTARRLERLLPPHSTRISLVNDVNFMLYTPLLPGAAGGTLEPRHVVVPLREELERTQLHLGRITGADLERRVVSVRTPAGHHEELSYDQLVVSLGSVSRTLPIPGLTEHALGFKTLSEAIAWRNQLVLTLEEAETNPDEQEREALLTYVVVGAGYAGLEGIAELQDFASDVVDRYPRNRVHGLRFILVEARDRVMPEIPAKLADFASAELRRRGIEIHTATTVDRVEADAVHLSTGERVATRTVCWTAGVKAHPIVAELGLPLDDDGRIATDSRCSVKGFENVWAIGDAAGIPDPARPGQPCPPTCQHAIRQAKTAAFNVASALGGSRRRRRFRYKTLGVFVDMGRHQAVASTLGIRWRGFPAWFLARTYHLAMMPGAKRKTRLVTDWTVSLLFGRDSSELGQLGRSATLGATLLEQSSGGTTSDAQPHDQPTLV